MGNRIGGLTCLDDRETTPPRALSSTIRTELGGVLTAQAKGLTARDSALCRRLYVLVLIHRGLSGSPATDSVHHSSRPSATGQRRLRATRWKPSGANTSTGCSSSADALSKRSLRVVRRALQRLGGLITTTDRRLSWAVGMGYRHPHYVVGHTRKIGIARELRSRSQPLGSRRGEVRQSDLVGYRMEFD